MTSVKNYNNNKSNINKRR